MKTIYISGPITDQKTGLPREGWQKDFLEAEAKLRRMGFYVINPVDIAREVENAMKWRYYHVGGPCSCDGGPDKPSRADYIMACLQRMKMAHEADMLHGVYVIDVDKYDEDLVIDPRESHGVMMELRMAELLGIPIFAEYVNARVDYSVYPNGVPGTIEEFAKED